MRSTEGNVVDVELTVPPKNSSPETLKQPYVPPYREPGTWDPSSQGHEILDPAPLV